MFLESREAIASIEQEGITEKKIPAKLSRVRVKNKELFRYTNNTYSL